MNVPVVKPGQQVHLHSVFLADETHRITITGTPTGGGVLVALLGQVTDLVPFDAQAVTLQDALEELRVVGAGNVRCTGGPWPATPIDVQYVEDLGKRQRDLPILTSQLTGGSSPAAAATRQVPGGQVQPTTVTYVITDPAGDDTTLPTWTGIDAAIVREGPAQFVHVFDVPTTLIDGQYGRWAWSAKGDGGGMETVDEGAFIVERRTAA